MDKINIKALRVGDYGGCVEKYNVLDSTNIRAKTWAKSGAPNGAVIIADRQTAGYGRNARNWSHSAGNLAMSFIINSRDMRDKLPLFSAYAGYAAARAIDNGACIKWPNDILLGGYKVSGILCESGFLSNGGYWAVIGIGVNIASAPEDVAHAAALSRFGINIYRTQLIRRIFYYFSRAACDENFIKIYSELSATVGAEVRVLHGKGGYTGKAVGIDESGALLVKTGGGISRIISGEVSVRGIYGYSD